jgi:hypothetical protein
MKNIKHGSTCKKCDGRMARPNDKKYVFNNSDIEKSVRE